MQLKPNSFEEIISYLESQPWIFSLFNRLRSQGLEEKFLQEVFSYEPYKEKHRRNFIKALAIANEIDQKYSYAKDKWAFFGGMAVLGHLAKRLGIEKAMQEKGCTDIDIVIDNSFLSPTELKKNYDIQVGVIYPCEKFYMYDINLDKIENPSIYGIRFPIISLEDLIKLKEQTIKDPDCKRRKKHERDLSLLERYVIKSTA